LVEEYLHLHTGEDIQAWAAERITLIGYGKYSNKLSLKQLTVTSYFDLMIRPESTSKKQYEIEHTVWLSEDIPLLTIERCIIADSIEEALEWYILTNDSRCMAADDGEMLAITMKDNFFRYKLQSITVYPA
jgi:hypothetical protein